MVGSAPYGARHFQGLVFHWGLYFRLHFLLVFRRPILRATMASLLKVVLGRLFGYYVVSRCHGAFLYSYGHYMRWVPIRGRTKSKGGQGSGNQVLQSL